MTAVASTRRVALAALLAAAACSSDARFRVYEADDGSFRVSFLAPPWEIEETGARTVRLRVPRAVESRTGGIPLPPVYTLDAAIESGTAEARARADAQGAASRHESVIAEARPVDTDCGAAGFETLTVGDGSVDTLHRRFVSLSVPGGVLRLVFVSVHPLDEAEVSTMIDRVEVEACGE